MKFSVIFLSVLLVLEPMILLAQPGLSQVNYDKAEFCTENVNFYATPDDNSTDLIQQISGTETFTVIDSKGDWYLIKLSDDRAGWVKKSSIRFVEEVVSTEEKPVDNSKTLPSSVRRDEKIYVELQESGSGNVTESGSIDLDIQYDWKPYLGKEPIDIIQFLELTGYQEEADEYKAYEEANRKHDERNQGARFFANFAAIGTMIILGIMYFNEKKNSGETMSETESPGEGIVYLGLGVGIIFSAIFTRGHRPERPDPIPYKMACDMAEEYNQKLEINSTGGGE